MVDERILLGRFNTAAPLGRWAIHWNLGVLEHQGYQYSGQKRYATQFISVVPCSNQTPSNIQCVMIMEAANSEVTRLTVVSAGPNRLTGATIPTFMHPAKVQSPLLLGQARPSSRRTVTPRTLSARHNIWYPVPAHQELVRPTQLFSGGPLLITLAS